MKQGIRVGQAGSVPVYLRGSWFAVAALITVVYARTVRAEVAVQPGVAYLIAFGFAVLLLLSVFIHELAHAWAAAATGNPASQIVLSLWGGHTVFDEESIGPWQSIAVSVVGPLSNVLIAVLAGAGVRIVDPDGVPRLLLTGTVTANLLVAVFNALPGLPLDGGRVLEALIWRWTGNRLTGTVAAGRVGQGFAVVVVGWGLAEVISGHRPPLTAIWLLAVAGPLWLGARQAIDAARWYQRAGLARIEQLMQPAVAVPSTATVATALLAAAQVGATAVVVLDVYGRAAAVLDERAAAGIPTARADQVGVAAVSEPLPDGAVLTAGLAGEALVDRLQARPTSRYAVLNSQEHVIGVLDWDDVAQFVARR